MTTLVAKAIFIIQLNLGLIIPTDDVDGRVIYSIPSANIEYAYEGEVLEYIQTGTFEYNEDLQGN